MEVEVRINNRINDNYRNNTIYLIHMYEYIRIKINHHYLLL